MKEQISEEFADKLLNVIWDIDTRSAIVKNRECAKEGWKEEGYIKQTRENEIREELSKWSIFPVFEEHKNDIIKLQAELIEILDNKIKELK